MPIVAFVPPGGHPAGQRLQELGNLVDAMQTVEGRKIVEFDDWLGGPCLIPAVPTGETPGR